MTRSLSPAARGVPSMVSNPRSTKVREFGASGGAAIGIWVIQA